MALLYSNMKKGNRKNRLSLMGMHFVYAFTLNIKHTQSRYRNVLRKMGTLAMAATLSKYFTFLFNTFNPKRKQFALEKQIKFILSMFKCRLLSQSNSRFRKKKYGVTKVFFGVGRTLLLDVAENLLFVFSNLPFGKLHYISIA